ncbi:hypothetical protein JSY36_04755 [Bacillus sp. H-16]|nr:hypothetical protein [Alteribacter salitolerans]MBM7095062.1 hypothetical protein [Alteribacter salitolerans]
MVGRLIGLLILFWAVALLLSVIGGFVQVLIVLGLLYFIFRFFAYAGK